MISRIEGSGTIRTTTTVRHVNKSRDGDGFAKQLEEANEASSSSAAAQAGATNLVTGVLGLQEVDDATARASRGKLRAENILEELENLRLDLLCGTISRERLLKLVRLVNSRRATISDPHLCEILDEIDLRAQVELAKYSHA